MGGGGICHMINLSSNCKHAEGFATSSWFYIWAGRGRIYIRARALVAWCARLSDKEGVRQKLKVRTSMRPEHQPAGV